MTEEIVRLLDEAEQKLTEAVPEIGDAMGPSMFALQMAGVAMGRAQLLLLRALYEQVLYPPRVVVVDGDSPPLGLSTTRQLLDEIRARGEIENHYEDLGHEMAIGAANLMDRLPGSMLDYRTVGGG